MIKAVSFDLGGIIFNKKNLSSAQIEEIFKEVGIPCGILWKNFLKVTPKSQILIKLEDYFKKILKYNYQIQDFRIIRSKKYFYLRSKKIRPLLINLKRKGLKLYISSHFSKKQIENLLKEYNLNEFEAIISSCDKVSKKDGSMFLKLSQLSYLNNNEILVVDDKEKYLKCAKILGFQTAKNFQSIKKKCGII